MWPKKKKNILPHYLYDVTSKKATFLILTCYIYIFVSNFHKTQRQLIQYDIPLQVPETILHSIS